MKPPWVTIVSSQAVLDPKERDRFFEKRRTRFNGALNIYACKKHVELISSDIEVTRNMAKGIAELGSLRRR